MKFRLFLVLIFCALQSNTFGQALARPSKTGTGDQGQLRDILPNQVGKSGKVLGTNGTVVSWVTGGGGGSGDVIGPATSADDSIPIFNGTNNKTIEASSWKIATSGTVLQSPITPNSSTETIVQRWGGLLASGGQVGGGNSEIAMTMVRGNAGAGNPTTKITDNWGVVYNPDSTTGIPKYGWNFETLFDTSGAPGGGGVAQETYLVNQVVGNDAESPVGRRLLQWNVILPSSFGVNPSAADAYNAANGLFPGHVGLLGTMNFFHFNAYNAAQAARGGFSWDATAATSGIRLVSNTGYTFADFTEWGLRDNANDFAVVGSTYTNFNLRNSASGYTAADGAQMSLESTNNFYFRNKENGDVVISPNSSSSEGLLWLTKGQRVFIGYNAITPPTDSGDVFQVKGNAKFGTSATGDTTLTIQGGTYPGMTINSAGLGNVDFVTNDTTEFLIRVNANKPISFATNGQSRLTVHTAIAATVPITTSSTTASTSTTTGSGIFAGGVGVAGRLNVGSSVTVAGGIVGTITNDNATALNVGEYVSSLVATGSAVSLTTNATANVTSISLTAGDWDVDGIVNLNASAATVTAMSGGVTSTSATIPSDGSEGYSGVLLTIASAVDSITLPRKRISIASTTTVYLVGRSTFSAGTVAAFGSITARRVR